MVQMRKDVRQTVTAPVPSISNVESQLNVDSVEQQKRQRDKYLEAPRDTQMYAYRKRLSGSG